MAADPNRLAWVDLEMTGLVPESDRIIEIALLVTDSELNLMDDGLVLVVRQPSEVLAAVDSGKAGGPGKAGLEREGARGTARRGGRGAARARLSGAAGAGARSYSRNPSP